MLDFMPIEDFPCPQGQPVLVHLVDGREAFAINESDSWDSCWIIQLPFKEPEASHDLFIQDWAHLSEKKEVK